MWSEFLATGRALAETYRREWRRLLAVGLIAKFVGFVVLFPLAGLVLRALLAVSGNALLADTEIISFLLGPVGWVILVLVASLGLTILAVEIAIMLAHLVAVEESGRTTLRRLVIFGLHRWRPIFGVTWRLVVRLVLLAVPFLAAAALVAVMLLRRHDINFYLEHRPPEFIIALAAGALLAAVLAVVAALLSARWFFALPLALFGECNAQNALAESARRSLGHRKSVFAFILAVILALALFSTFVSGLLATVTAWVLGGVERVPWLFVLVLGAAAILWMVVHVLLSLVADTVFASAVAIVYRRYAQQRISPEVLAAFQPEGELSRGRVPAVVVWLAALAALPAAGGVGWYLLAGMPVEESVSILAHRAGALSGPENTLAAIEKAIDLGADYVEIDVQETADGHIVLAHDRDLMRVAGVPLVIEESTLAQLQQVDIGGFFAPRYSDQRVPELADVLTACRGRIKVAIELKHYGRVNQLEQRVLDCVEACAMADQVVLMSLDRASTARLKRLRPDWRVGQLTAVAVGDLTQDKVDFLAVSSSLATAGLLDRAHGRGQQVYVWTINDPVLMSVMLSRGVDGVITDDVPMATEVLRQRAEMTPIERLMLEAAVFLGRVPSEADDQASSGEAPRTGSVRGRDAASAAGSRPYDNSTPGLRALISGRPT